MAKKKTKPVAGKVSNRRARFDYELGASLIVGLQLTGAETKALRLGQGKITGSYITVKNGELWLVGAQITGNRAVYIEPSDQMRDRKLLAHKNELANLTEARKQGSTIVPIELLTGGRYLKLKIATGKGRKRYDKREVIKKRQQQRDIARHVRI
jgi:SsrA-binding protein